MTESPCPLCLPNEQEILLWRDELCRVIWVDDRDYPGFCRVIVNAHVGEMTDLQKSERHRLMTVVFALEQAVREIVHPDKINLASLGNYVPHLHWHIIPRWREDTTFPDAIWAPAKRPGIFGRKATTGHRQRIHHRLNELLQGPA